jgi:hypothetical protein
VTTNASAPASLSIGVALAPSFACRGDSLADARAYEAAGCDSLWLEGAEDPWLAAAALAVVTTRLRLVVPAAEEDLATTAFARRAGTLLRLLPGRLVVSCRAVDLVRAVREAVRCPVYVSGSAAAAVPAAGADGVLLDSAEASAPGASRPARDVPVWLMCAPPGDRVAWRELRRRALASGAAGVVLPSTPRLLDLLRNPDRDDDRSDLKLAHG